LVSHNKEECKLKVFENRILRRLHGLKRKAEGRGRRIFHKKEFNSLYFRRTLGTLG